MQSLQNTLRSEDAAFQRSEKRRRDEFERQAQFEREKENREIQHENQLLKMRVLTLQHQVLFDQALKRQRTDEPPIVRNIQASFDPDSFLCFD